MTELVVKIEGPFKGDANSDILQALTRISASTSCEPVSTSQSWHRNDDHRLSHGANGVIGWDYLYLFISAIEFTGLDATPISAIASDGRYQRNQAVGGLVPLLESVSADGWDVAEFRSILMMDGRIPALMLDAAFTRARSLARR